MATTKSIDASNFADRAAPFLWGSLQDLSGMTTVDRAAPFLGVNDLPGLTFVMDTRGRLTNVNSTSGHGLQFNMDDAGNRTSVVTT